MRSKIENYIVVDDDATNNLICEFTIRRFNPTASIKICNDPEKALSWIGEIYSKIDQPKPTMLFLDLNMPSMTGWEFLEEFSGFKESLKEQFSIYVLTSSIEDFSEQSDRFPFVSGFLSKPMKIEKLEEIGVS